MGHFVKVKNCMKTQPKNQPKTVPELRFPGFVGDWEEKRLGEVGETYNGLTGKTKDDFGHGERFITYKQIFDSSVVNIDRFGFVNIANGDEQNRVKLGDILFTISSETPTEVGYSSVFLNEALQPYLNSFAFGFRPKSLNSMHPFFSRYLFRSPEFRKRVVRLAQGSTRFNLSKKAFLKIVIGLPVLKEQKKIAEFLTGIDELISSKQEQIEKAEEWKKGLMQKMFV